ncbi:MAG: methyl-accepting chemotaxis protein, partial [Gammaproteobacteria bacterium]|nr:methyl-accepting chemotaxis protein [Gammaproteobacteria bacterium]
GLFPVLSENTEDVIAQLIALNVEPNLVFLASNQLSLIQSIKSNLHHLDSKQRDTEQTLQLIKSDSDIFVSTLKKLLNGDASMGINPVRDGDTRASIEQLDKNFATITEIGARMNELLVKLNMSKNAYLRVNELTHQLFDKSNELASNFTNNNTYNLIATISGYILATICLFMAGILLFPKQTTPEFAAIIHNHDNETKAALNELEEKLSPIANGDFSADVKVSHNETQAIASTINYTTRALRSTLENIGKTSDQVLNVAEETQATSIHLAHSSDKQARHIGIVTDAIQKMALHFSSMAEHAQESSNLATTAVKMAENGNLAVQNTIASMQTINDDIDETASRIKRLGESSQEIGNIVELINEIAEQTNILALNAAIKSSTASPANDFSNVADEIQHLAERVTQATKKIESLVNSIQQDTNQAVLSMEQSSTDVINGSKLAEAAGSALNKIENVSTHLAAFINDVSQEASEINRNTGKLSTTMEKIKKLTDQNLVSSKQTANLNGKLAELAKNQREAVTSFSINTKEKNG